MDSRRRQGKETAGFAPAKIKEGQVWTILSGPVEPDSISLSVDPSALGTGRGVALALAISTDLTDDVTHYLTMTSQDIPVITVRPSTGTSNASITGPTHAYAIALAVRNLAREIARSNRPPVLHLFLAAPPDSPSFLALCGIVFRPRRHTKISGPTDMNPPLSSQTRVGSRPY